MCVGGTVTRVFRTRNWTWPGSVSEARVKALRDYHRPKHQKGLRAFLGTAGYYRKFIPDFARWAGPLLDALKKGTPCFLKWNKRESDAFNHIVSVLCDEHSLTIPRADDEFILHTDASVLRIGAVLSVKRVGEEQPVAYFSKRTTSAERNYTISELECLAVVKAVDHFAIHLIGCKFTVLTDH